ncbi:hypothetical protein AB0G60_13895 [Streptomyces angustmyceticus]|uniref:Uncharacterized protein n=1 Tax=Streptomyces angustmyceticus TaxID=285578 RepID=A0A5J4LM34_9ACTN|nr:hypothetical protein [Streptomyces angustmyceticus]UAL67582.1 hypothetical protein K7396_14410 [Streptomyces angustmyceticus]GES31355.1 hypothetical protein San01_38420 [Streptomyces angustmyceticus]
MVMQDGGTVDVRPDADPGRAAPEHGGAYLATALSLALYSCVLVAWTLYGLAQGEGSVWDFLEGLFNPGASPATQILGPYEWAFSVGFLVIAGLALARRRVARSAALLTGCVLLAVSLREAVGLFDAAYRDQYRLDPLGGWVLATRGLGLVVALVVLFALFPATERRDGHRSAPGTAGPDGWRLRSSRICGVLFLLMSLARIGWTVFTVAAPEVDARRYLRGVVDGSLLGTLDLAAPGDFTTVGSVLVLLVLGVLAFRGRRDVRGALMMFAALELYMTVRTVVMLTVTDFFNRSFETPEGALSLATTAYALAAMTSVVVLTTTRGSTPYPGLRTEGVRAAAVGRGGGL